MKTEKILSLSGNQAMNKETAGWMQEALRIFLITNRNWRQYIDRGEDYLYGQNRFDFCGVPVIVECELNVKESEDHVLRLICNGSVAIGDYWWTISDPDDEYFIKEWQVQDAYEGDNTATWDKNTKKLIARIMDAYADLVDNVERSCREISLVRPEDMCEYQSKDYNWI